MQVALTGDNGSEGTTLATVTQNGAGSVRVTCTFMPRFLLHHIVFDHGLIDGLGPTRRACREIYCAGRTGSSYEEVRSRNGYSFLCRKLLPTRGAQGANTSVPELGERWAKWAHVGWSPWHLCASKVDGPCAGCPDSISDSESEHWEWGLRRCGSPRDVTSPDAIPHLDIHFVHALWNLCAPSAFWLRIQQQRSFNDAGCHAVGGRGSGRGVCLCKPPSP